MIWNFVVEARKVGAIGIFYPVRLTYTLPAQTTQEARDQFFETGYSKEWEVNIILSVSPDVRSD